MAESFPDRWAFFSCKTTWPKQICRAAIYAILLWADCFWFCPAQQSHLRGPHQNISNPIWRFWHLHFVHVSSHGLIYLPHLILIFFFFCSWRKSISSLFQKKRKASLFFFHTARVPLCRRRKLLIFSFQNYKQANRINPLKKILIFFKNWLIFNSKEF